ncbi:MULTISPECIES: hypothetical protein [Aminobacter]|uniref:Uncharacterized protein n=3 Tax=Aminobacter TaxID=31988 RepID=A0ABR6H6Y5_AMIAI|nr:MULTISPECIES: hypothetical protein [Aminobacter]MBA8905512.1 hypothetical protein [Aminobacter ciceronei]MBA9019189.1 hypothetical protein [Aminobacter ciceronei]MBB3706259.1 hypothetical protein [Aminobacter aminovorans]
MTDQPMTDAQANQPTTATPTAPDNSPAPVSHSPGSTSPAPNSPLPGADAALQSFREQLAGGDAAMMKQLERYRSTDEISKAFREGYRNAKNGGRQVELTEKSTPEDVKAYRAANGIPEDAAQYPGAFREGFEVTDADRAILSDFKAAMHERHVPPKVAAAALDWYQDFAATQAQELNAQLAKVAGDTQKTLRSEWGGDYDGQIGAAQELMRAHLGDDGFGQMMGLRLMDGSRLQDNLGFVKMMATIGADYYGSTAILTGDIEATGKTLEAQQQELLALRVSDPEKYKSDAVQGKLTRIYAQLDKINARK